MPGLTTNHLTSATEPQGTFLPSLFGEHQLNFIYSLFHFNPTGTGLRKQARCGNNLNVCSELLVRKDAELRTSDSSW